MGWGFLLLAGAMEVFGVIAMKHYAMSGKNTYVLLIALLFMLSLSFLSLAMREIAMGVAYAIWTGIGACGGVMVGIVFFKESKNFDKLLLIGVIIACSMGLKYLGDLG